jgi:(1->4)-alpha-D-glucan 1-alpha-D-glucosylmutase
LTWKTLCLRQLQPALFQQGQYLPLAVAGTKANHVIAFSRKFENSSMIIVAPRLIATLLNNVDVPPLGTQIWEDTHILLPCFCREKCQNLLTGKDLELIQMENYNDGHTSRQTKISVASALAEFPVALCLLN